MPRGLEAELLSMIEHQKKVLYQLGREIIPHLTQEDILQPFDFPELENHPLFRYEEGVLMGLASALHALYALKKG